MAELPGKPKPPSAAEIEEGLAFTPRFDQAGLIGAIVTDAASGAVRSASVSIGSPVALLTIWPPR